MLRALRWFEIYVPKKVVERLIRQADVRETISDAREITIMFTDIVGFSAVSEGMSAPEVAEFVNTHFSLVASCIEAEDGTIDKFMGDAVMAFWGRQMIRVTVQRERVARPVPSLSQSMRTI